MKNIHITPTDQPSRLHYYENPFKEWFLSKEPLHWRTANHIYITSDEEIKEGDWVYDETSEELIYQVNVLPIPKQYPWKKVILTTDPTLIADGVQAINDEFLEWFVNNPTCNFVEVHESKYFDGSHADYIIIIPHEEPKPFDNLEERFKRDMSMVVMPLDNENIPEEEGKMITNWLDKHGDAKIMEQVELEAAAEIHYINCIPSDRHSFIKGAKWQAENFNGYLQGFIDQFGTGVLGELDPNEWDALQFLEWLKLNNYEIIKKK